MRKIDLIVIHCSASKNGKHLSMTDLIKEHQRRGFRTVGYHFIIDVDGVLHEGRSEYEVGAHVKGWNSKSLGICMIGLDRFTSEQWSSLYQLVTQLEKKYKNARVVGHRDLSPDLDGDGTVEPQEWIKTCPGFDVKTWYDNDMKPDPDNICSLVA